MREDGIDLRVASEAIEAIASQALERGTGARGLRAIVDRILVKSMFEHAGQGETGVVVVGSECVIREAASIWRAAMENTV